MIDQQTKSSELLERRHKVVSNGVGVFNTATVERADGGIIYDVDGRKLIDFAGGIGVVNAGHCPEPVVRAIREQAGKYLHTSFNVVTYEPYIQLCEELVRILPHGKDTKAMLVSTGAEAVENAVKIARQATGRQGVLCFTDAFHGRTMMAMTLTSKSGYKSGCGPFAPEVYRLRFPNYYRYGNGISEKDFVREELGKLYESALTVVDPKSLAAIILEPVQGEGGFYSVPQLYLEELREYCNRHGIMLILDEIQSGFGRTGHWASWQEYGVTPDISTYAKSLGSGMPIAAVVGKSHIMDSAAPGSIGGTYIGNPVCCAAALATIKYMENIDIFNKAREVASVINERLIPLQEECPEIGQIRSRGAMIAIEFVRDGDPQQPDSEIVHEIVTGCAEDGLIVISAGTHKNIIRILSPLVIEKEVLNQGMDILIHQIKKAVGIRYETI